MAREEKISIDERRKYLKLMQRRHLRADRGGKEKLLYEMKSVVDTHGQSLIRLMNGDLLRWPRSRQRGRTYGIYVLPALQVIAESLNYPCADRL